METKPSVPLMFMSRKFNFGLTEFTFMAGSVIAGDIIRYIEGRTEIIMRVELVAKDMETAYLYGTVVKRVRGKQVTKGKRAVWISLPLETVVRVIGRHDRTRRNL